MAITNEQVRRLNTAASCEVHTDPLTRQLYATDASIYQIVPQGVAFPRNADEAASVVHAAAEDNIPITPRGAGTGLAGGALGDGLIVDFSRHNLSITEFAPERRSIRVGTGVVLDQLNAFLKPHGLCFGPDVATSSRATLGGMIANNSSGAHVPVYGTTADHVLTLDVVTTAGEVATVGPDQDGLRTLADVLTPALDTFAGPIRDRMPDVLMKRWPGYGLDRWLREPGDLTKLIAGSEGTLVAMVSAELSLSPLPENKGIAAICFASAAEAMQATVELLDLNPAAVEHIDRVLFDQTRGQLPFQPARDLLDLEAQPCESILIVEFYEDVEDKLNAVETRSLGLRTSIFTDPSEMNRVWGLRKAGLSLLTGCKGAAKPIAGIEDVAVQPQQLPEYVTALQDTMARLNLSGSFYGHAASGLLHVRPVIDLHKAEDITKYRILASEVSDLVKQFKGSIAAEHGVGIARTEYLADQMGPEVMDAMRLVKQQFDPRNVMNPGKIIAGDERYRIDDRLRWGAEHRIELDFEPVLKFAAKDESFVGNLEQCNGCGGCRKATPTMCPTFMATGDEVMSTRGRANTIRAALEGRLGGVRDSTLEVALSNCLSCKACTTECPSNVNMALLKAELVHAKHQVHGVSLSERLIANVDLLGKLGCMFPWLSNTMLKSKWMRRQLRYKAGFSEQRPLPPFARQRFDRWFARTASHTNSTRGHVVLWDDTFVRYHEPRIGQAAVKVLEALGHEVVLMLGRKCCGRPAFSTGQLDRAAKLGQHNLELLSRAGDDAPIIFLEPSCYSMFVEEYRELGLPNAETVADRCVLFEHFVEALLEREPDAVEFEEGYSWVALHSHCHAKALTDTGVMTRLIQRLPNVELTVLDTGCCGMAGAFGQLDTKYELSVQVAQPLVDQIHDLTAGTEVIASGTSCRHQIDHLTEVAPVHMAELLAGALK
jgi:FAD/FMN-containing dehydrogenase/Fe-S oxidoreductase